MSTITVFVCGTYADLSEERGRVLDALSRLQLPRRSMELFGARTKQPIDVCLAEVGRSQLLIVVVGNRYGSLVPGQTVSFSEAEYREAIRLGIPCLVYLRKPDPSSTRHVALDEALERWKRVLMDHHTVHYFGDAGELAVQVTVDVVREVRDLEQAPIGTDDETSSSVGVARLGLRTSRSFGDAQRQLLYDLVVDGAGNTVVIGSFWGTVAFGAEAPTLKSPGNQSIFVSKFDSDGEHIWSKAFGDKNEQVGEAVAVDDDDNVWIASAFTGALTFGGQLLASRGRYNVAVVKLDRAGNHLWSRAFGDDGYHVPECIEATPDGNVVLAGRFRGTLDFGHDALVSTSAQTDVFLASFASGGTSLWARRIAGPFEQQARSLAIADDGSIALVGVFKGRISFGEMELVARDDTDYAAFLVVMDEEGTPAWCKKIGDPTAEQGTAVAFDSHNGDVVVAGFIRNALPPKSTGASSVVLLARYDRHGILRWSKTFGANAFPRSVRVDGKGRVLITGHFTGEFALDSMVMKSAGANDIFAAVFSADGGLEWAQRYGDAREQFLVKGAFGPKGSVVLGGSFHGTIDFGSGPLIATGYDGLHECAEDVFLAVLGPR
jgi:hypothetical protein